MPWRRRRRAALAAAGGGPGNKAKALTEVPEKVGEAIAAGGGKVGDTRALLEQLTPWARALLDSLPFFIRQQLLLESTASDDSAQLGQIETERLLATLVLQNLEQRKRDAMLNAEPFCDPKFTTVCFYLGYQAESAPSLPAPPPNH